MRLLSTVLCAISLASGGFAQSGLPIANTPAPSAGAAIAADANRPRAYMIELTAEPTAVTLANARDRAASKGAKAAEELANLAAVSQLVIVEREQAPFVDALRTGDIDGTFLYAVQRVENGVAALMTTDEAARVAKMPGVRAVRPIATYGIGTTAAVSLVGAPALWSPNGHRGDGVRIGIIDSGVDYLHADLGGPGVYDRTDYTAGNVPWNAKVVGGIDLAGDDYDIGSSDSRKWIPHPDPDPMDCGGHGTHVAGIAAGIGVKSDGTPFSGPYPATLDPAAFRIGPGVAPAAKIYAIRVFGCSGLTNLIDQALDWALDPNQDGNLSDHLDIVNLSIGSNYGETFWRASSAPIDNAAAAGMIVVASAGNAGKQHYIVGSPSTAARAISVAASIDSTDTMEAFTVTAPAALAGVKVGQPSSSYNWRAMKAPLTGDVVYPPSQRTGCETFTPANATLLAGKIALIDWTDGGCKSWTRVDNAAAAGAIGVLFAYPKQTRLDTSIGGSAAIPAMVTTREVAEAIKGATSPVTVTFDASVFGKAMRTIVDDSDTDTLATFSSRGPRVTDGMLKPDISAPGETIFSAAVRSGNLGVSKSGTSMAGPMVAGGMALLKQLHPDWTVEELKALAVNSATSDIYGRASQSLPLESPAAAGAGRLSLPDAELLDVVAYATDNPGSVGVSFGFVEVPGDTSAERTFKVVNKSSTPAVVTLNYVPITSVPGVSFDFPSGTTVTVAPNSSAVARIRLTANASQMRHVRDPLLDATQGGYPRYWVSEASGRIELMRGFTPFRLPVHAIVRPASQMRATTKGLDLNAQSGHAEIALSGSSFETGTSYPNDWVSLVAPFELQETVQRNVAINAWQNLRYVGVTSDYASHGGSINDTMLYFGIATWGSWYSPTEFDIKVLVDTKNTTDRYQRAIFNTNAGTFLGSDPNDVHVAALCPWPLPSLPSAQCTSQYMNAFGGDNADTGVLNNSVIRFAVRASALGLTAGQTQFAYTVVSYDKITGAIVDRTPRLWFDPARSLNLFGTGNSPSGIFFDRATNAIPIDWGAGDVGNSTGILLLHYFNVEGTRAEIVPINAAGKNRAARH